MPSLSLAERYRSRGWVLDMRGFATRKGNKFPSVSNALPFASNVTGGFPIKTHQSSETPRRIDGVALPSSLARLTLKPSEQSAPRAAPIRPPRIGTEKSHPVLQRDAGQRET